MAWGLRFREAGRDAGVIPNPNQGVLLSGSFHASYHHEYHGLESPESLRNGFLKKDCYESSYKVF